MQLSPREAEALVGQMFPGCEAYVADGNEEHESGVVTSPRGVTIASFRLLYREPWHADTTPHVSEIRVGDVGQFCGTMEELGAYEKSRSSLVSSPATPDDRSLTNPDVQAGSARIMPVSMQVDRVETVLEDNLAQVWGHVGDYEVAMWMSLDDPRIKVIRRAAPANS
ncbi:MAG: hypothetical protein NTY19_28290 [Planctomycetota bacterium]|nr:hypothetical protein [Planctomycetota bacterium]